MLLNFWENTMSRLTLVSVQRDFKAWRASKTKIPEALWNKTLKLLDHYPISNGGSRFKIMWRSSIG